MPKLRSEKGKTARIKKTKVITKENKDSRKESKTEKLRQQKLDFPLKKLSKSDRLIQNPKYASSKYTTTPTKGKSLLEIGTIIQELDAPIKSNTRAQPHEELQYIQMLKNVIQNGNYKKTSYGETRALFGHQIRFDLSKSFPLLTTKKMGIRWLIEELLWFIKGETNANILNNKGVYTWKENSSRSFLDKRGFKEREINDIGPLYGFQWRHFGAKYSTMHKNYQGQGIDQLRNAITDLQTHPTRRSIIISAWDVTNLKEMNLPPCTVIYHFNIINNKLNCLLYQRSCDMCLGVPFDIAQGALLTVLISKIIKVPLGDFVHTFGDYHIYLNHMENAKEQIKRSPKPFPRLEITRILNNVEDLEQLKFEEFKFIDYDPHPYLSYKLNT